MFSSLSGLFPACTMISGTRPLVQVTSRQPGDEKLGFEGCVAALGRLCLVLN